MDTSAKAASHDAAISSAFPGRATLPSGSHVAAQQNSNARLLKPFMAYFEASNDSISSTHSATRTSSAIANVVKRTGQDDYLKVKALASDKVPGFEKLTPITQALICQGYAAACSKNPESAMTLFRKMSGAEDTFWLRSGLSFGAQNEGSAENFAATLKKAAADVPADQRIAVMEYADALLKCKLLGIDYPFRFTPQVLSAIVSERLNPQTSKPLLVMPSAKSDWSGSLNDLDRIASQFIARGFRVQYMEISTDREFADALKSATQAGRFKADSVCLSGHGTRTEISLGGEDPGHARIVNNNLVLDFSDQEIIRQAGSYIRPGASLILNACSAGQGASDRPDNLANFFRQCIPTLGDRQIFSLTGDGTIEDVIFTSEAGSNKVDAVRGLNEDGQTAAEVYQARFVKEVKKDLAA